MASNHWITKRNRRPKNNRRGRRAKQQIAKTMAKLRELAKADNAGQTDLNAVLTS